MEYVESARAVGAPPSRLLLAHILPNALSPILVEATFGIARAIVAEAGLSFLGWRGAARGLLGLDDRRREALPLRRAPPGHAPGAAILLTVMSFNFVGDGLRDALDRRT